MSRVGVGEWEFKGVAEPEGRGEGEDEFKGEKFARSLCVAEPEDAVMVSIVGAREKRLVVSIVKIMEYKCIYMYVCKKKRESR